MDFSKMNPFANKQQQPAPIQMTPNVQNPNQSQQGNQQQANTGNGNGTPTATLPNNANGQQAPADPLAPFAKMYDTVAQQDTAPQFALDEKALSTAASSLDFMKGIDPQLKERAMTGDATAIMELIAHGSRQAYQHALSHSSTLTGKFTDAREAYNSKSFSGKVRNELTVNALTGTPNYSHPVVRKELIRVSKEIQAQNPDASPQEVADQARQYLTEISGALNPTNTAQEQQSKGKSVNWDNYFDNDGQGS